MNAAATLERTTPIAIAIVSVVAVALAGALWLRFGGVRELDAIELPAEPVPIESSVGAAPLRGGLPSLEAVGEALVAGLAAGDPAALAALVVDPEDFKGRLFGVLSNHPSAAQMGPELLWDMQSRESRDDMERAIELHGGRPLRLVSIEASSVERRLGITLHRRPRLVVEDVESGAQTSLQIISSIVEHEASGTHVILAYRYRGAAP